MKLYPLAFALIFVAGLIGLAVGPWWTLAAVALVVGLVLRPRTPGVMFWPGLLAGAALWAIGALWYGADAGELPGLVAELLGVRSALGIGAVVALVGGLTAGLFTLLGAYARAVIQVPKRR